MTFYQQSQEQQSRSLSRLLISLMLISFFILTPGSGAQEATPVDSISPSQSEPAIGHLPEDTTLAITNNTVLDKPMGQCGSQPNLWNWLLNASSKPANFHYIDIIELLN